MKRAEFTLHGKVSDKGQLMTANRKDMDIFFKQWPGKIIVGTFEVVDSGSRKAALAYYWGTILPGFQECLFRAGTRLSTHKVDIAIRETTTSSKETENKEGSPTERTLDLSEMSAQRIWNMCDEIKQLVAEQFDESIG